MLLNGLGGIPKFFLDSIDSWFSWLPEPLRLPAAVVVLAGWFWMIGLAEGEDRPESKLSQISRGAGITVTKLGQWTKTLLPVAIRVLYRAASEIIGMLSSAAGWMREYGGSLIEVEEAPIKIGPLVEIYGIKISFVRAVALLLVAVFGLSEFSGVTEISPLF